MAARYNNWLMGVTMGLFDYARSENDMSASNLEAILQDVIDSIKNGTLPFNVAPTLTRLSKLSCGAMLKILYL